MDIKLVEREEKLVLIHSYYFTRSDIIIIDGGYKNLNLLFFDHMWIRILKQPLNYPGKHQNS